MHKNPLQNTGKRIEETLFFKIFRGSMHPDLLEVSAYLARVGQSHVCPPPPKKKFMGPYAYGNAIKKVLEKKFVP